MPTNTIVDQLKNLPLFFETKKKESEETVREETTYGERPEFQPHIGQNYESSSERTLVISEIFSTKKDNRDDWKKDESYCEYVLKNANNPSCVNIQLALQRYDENLTADNIAFCFFIHKETVKVGSYRSDFSPKDLDDAIDSLVPLINLLKPRKIVFLGSQTKRTVERRSGSKALKRKSVEQFLAESSIETEVISLRASNEKKVDDVDYVEETDWLAMEFLFNTWKLTIKYLDSRNTDNQHTVSSIFSSELKQLTKFEECTNRIEESYAKIKKLIDNDASNSKEELFQGKNPHYENNLINVEHYVVEIQENVDFVTKQVNTIAKYINCYQKFINFRSDENQLTYKEQSIKDMTKSLIRILNDTKRTFQRWLVPIKATRDSLIERTDVSALSMLQKIEFVKNIVKELRPKSNDDPGQVMSLQMVAKRLNESNPPITTALGKKYDNKGKGVIVLLRNVYKTLVESSSEEDQNIAAEMLHCFTKRPVVKVFVRNEDNVTEEEYWKPFKNMETKES